MFHLHPPWSRPRKFKQLIILFALTIVLLTGVVGFPILNKRIHFRDLIYPYLVKPPSQVHFAWTQDPATSLNLRWHTRRLDTPSTIEYREQGTEEWHTAVGEQLVASARGANHEVELQNLTPNTTYDYRIKGDWVSNFWSDIHQVRTAPRDREGEFEAIYFADTGLTGRRDGLDTGLPHIIYDIAAQKPLLTLAGGDYAYYDTDKRHGSLEASIDAWFNQMAPVFTESVVMPTYGNHEALLRENLTPWMKRFATPTGTPDRRNYSFDVGHAHFVSIFAVFEGQGLNPEALEWIRNDIQAAQERGQTWIIPYMHVSAFAEGASHPSNLALRSQLGPLFESLGVKLVFSSHDQAFERTFPLVDVLEQNRPTSTDKTCYTLADGVTWLKSSPAGKESNKNKGFSIFNDDPSPWVAVRDNTMHVFTKLHISADDLVVTTYGVKDSGKLPTELDTFKYTKNLCPTG